MAAVRGGDHQPGRYHHLAVDLTHALGNGLVTRCVPIRYHRGISTAPVFDADGFASHKVTDIGFNALHGVSGVNSKIHCRHCLNGQNVRFYTARQHGWRGGGAQHGVGGGGATELLID